MSEENNADKVDKIEFDTTSVFLNNYSSQKRININRWGTRSWKTYNLMVLFVFWLLYWKIDENKVFKTWVLTVVRKYWSNLKNTVIRDLEEIIDFYWVRHLIQINKTDRTYKYNWRMIEFIGADDQQKLRWGKRDILYCNEANELNYKQEFFQLNIRTKYKVFIDFNPDDEDIWINTELEQIRRLNEKDIRVIISTYKDNPHLTPLEVREIEILAKTDPQFWKIYWLWQYWKITWLVFDTFEEIKRVPENAKFIWYGQDFWFSNDPTTLIGVYRYDWYLLFDEVIWSTWLTNQDIVNKYKELWIKTSDDIIADSAEPKSIEEISRAWFNIKGATKWPDSIKFWIDIIKQFPILITESSLNLRKEFKKYKWAVDKEWKSLNKPIDNFNHWIDAIRYLCMEKLKTTVEPQIFIL